MVSTLCYVIQVYHTVPSMDQKHDQAIKVISVKTEHTCTKIKVISKGCRVIKFVGYVK